MERARRRIAAAARAGAAFVPEAWRDAWAPLGLLAVGQGIAFASTHLDIPNTLSGKLQLGGWAVSLLALVPALGALYRSAVGGLARRRLGLGGLQIGRVEGRLLLVLTLLGLAAVAAAAPMVFVAGAIWYPLREAGVVRLPLLGPFGLWFLAAFPLLALAGAAAFVGLSRLALALPAAAAERRLDLMRNWTASHAWGGSLALTALLAEVLPLAAVVALAGLLAQVQRWHLGFGGSVWPLADTVIAAAGFSLFCAFVVLPFGVGARTAFYGRALAEARARRADEDALTPEAVAATVDALPQTPPADETASDDAATEEPVLDAAAEGEATTETAAADPVEGAEPVAAVSEEAFEGAEAAVAPEPPTTAQVEPPVSAVDAAPPATAAEAVAAVPPAPLSDTDQAAQVASEPASPTEIPAAATSAAAAWVPPVAPLRGVGLAQEVTTPVLLAHANDRALPPPWWLPPEHPGKPPVA